MMPRNNQTFLAPKKSSLNNVSGGSVFGIILYQVSIINEICTVFVFCISQVYSRSKLED